MNSVTRTSKILPVILSLVILALTFHAFVLNAQTEEPPTRTVMLYLVGADLEGYDGFATYNLTESMKADYNGHLQFIVMTGGSEAWYTGSEYLIGAEEIDPVVNQIWILEGKKDGEEHGAMTLLEPDGLPGFEDSEMSDPAALSAFIDYCYANYSADLYDLILWDHGGGPVGGFGFDDRYWTMMTFADVIEGIQSNELIRSGKKFEIIDFDACIMSTTDIVAALSLYADYLVLSAETEPGAGQDYSSWLNALAGDPSMNGFDLGREIVDGMMDFYTNREEDYATLSVIDTKNFADRLLPALAELDGILIDEAVNKGDANGRYNFYDELYSIKYSIGYAMDEESLYDLGNLAGALSVPQTEFDVLTSEDIRMLRNVYTDVALRILDILADNDNSGDDVIYSGYTASTAKKLKSVKVRGLDKEIIAPDLSDLVTVYPTGISLFCGDASMVNALTYMMATEDALALLPDSPQKDYLAMRPAAPALYSMIFGFGETVSNLALEEQYDRDYGELKQGLTQKRRWYRYDMLTDYLVSAGVFDSKQAAENYLAEIAEQQSGEVLHPENVSVKKREQYFDSGDTYKVTIDNISAHNIAAVGSSMDVYISSDIPELQHLINKVYGGIPFDELYPGGIHFTVGEIGGTPDMTEFTDYSLDVQYDLMKDFYAADRISWVVPEAERKCLVLVDGNGTVHAADISFTDSSKDSGYVTVLIKTDANEFSLGFLIVKRDNGAMKVKGLSLDSEDISERSFIPMDSERFRGCSFAPAAFVIDEKYYVPVALPVSAFCAADVDKPFWGISFEEMATDDVGDITGVKDMFYIDDIYTTWYRNDVTELFEIADEKAEQGDLVRSIAAAEITVAPIVYNGESQKPVVTVVFDGKTLTEGVDYVLLYDGSAQPGPAMLLAAGIGDYFGTPAMIYTVSCAEHTFSEISYTAPSCTEDGSRELICLVCGDTATEKVPKTGHDLILTEAKKATKDADGNREYRTCKNCGKIFLDDGCTKETTAGKVVTKYFEYGHDPSENPQAMKDIVKDENAVYGFRPSETGSLKQYAGADWSDPDLVESGRQDRIAYHQSLEAMYDMLRQMQSEGKSTEEIARALSAKRNEIRLEAYKDDPEGLALLKQRNLEKYGHEEGPLPDELYAQYGSWEKVAEKAFSPNVGMDACLGLYDDYYDLYVFLGLAGDGSSQGQTPNPGTSDGGYTVFLLAFTVIGAGSLISLLARRKNLT